MRLFLVEHVNEFTYYALHTAHFTLSNCT